MSLEFWIEISVLGVAMAIGLFGRRSDIYSPEFVMILVLSVWGMIVAQSTRKGWTLISCGVKFFDDFLPCYRYEVPHPPGDRFPGPQFYAVVGLSGLAYCVTMIIRVLLFPEAKRRPR